VTVFGDFGDFNDAVSDNDRVFDGCGDCGRFVDSSLEDAEVVKTPEGDVGEFNDFSFGAETVEDSAGSSKV
jgi:hypothetical protein